MNPRSTGDFGEQVGVPKASVIEAIKKQQRAWALRNSLTPSDDGYCACADDNVFQALSPSARKEFENGDGTELGKAGQRGKLQALHSSSALACNWFDYWRHRDLEPLSRVFGVSSDFREVALEQKFHTGLGGIGPNLDVLLTCADGTLFGIESKFTEPYTKSGSKTFLKPKYFLGRRSLWTEKGLPGCQAVADGLRDGRHRFKVLDVAQLLKHMLALAHSGSSWSLCCLWFERLGPLAEQHRAELDELAMQLGDDAAYFSALTYQELFARMVPILGQQHAGYMAYLSDRYMSDPGTGVTPV